MRDDFRKAALALIEKLDAAEPHIDAMCAMGHNRGTPYKGPTYGVELEALRAAASGDSTPPSAPVQGDPSGALRTEPEAVGQGRWWRKKPVVIEAFQWNGLESGCQAAKARFPELETSSKSGHLRRPEVTSWHIRTLEGHMRVSPGDWIVRGVAGEFYPCKPDIFAATYEPAEPPQAASVERGD